MLQTYKKYLLPGFVFQSIVIGGGYGTGRELVEFFLRQGPLPGYLGMLVATVIWGVVLAFGFELARMGRYYDYRTFTKALLGKAWIALDALVILSMVLTVAVVGSASGELLNQVFGWPTIAGTVLLTGVVALLAYRGSGLVERFFAVWSLLLYAVYLRMIVLVLQTRSGEIASNAVIWDPQAPWLVGGLKYAAYNLAALPVMLFVVRHIESRRQAVAAGFIAGGIAMFPGALIYTALLAFYPGIVDEPIPAVRVLSTLNWPAFEFVFQLVLFGTFIETGAGMIHGFNERIAGYLSEQGKTLTHWNRLAIASIVLVASVWLADRFGLVALISQGYGTITFGFWLVFLLPVLAAGVWKIVLGR